MVFMKRKLITITSLALISSMVLSACSSSKPAGTGTQTPQSSSASSSAPQDSAKPAAGGKLRMMAGNVGGKSPEENKLFEKELNRLTGFEATLEQPTGDYNQKLLTALSSGEKYDLIEVSDLNQLSQFIKQGVVSDLSSFVKDSKVLSDPKVIPSAEWDQLKGPDGKVYGVFSKFQGGTMPLIRQDWLDKLKLPAPKTLDDYYNVMKAFKEQDPDGNGKPDTYGLSTSALYDIQAFMSSAGLKYRYVMKDNKRTIPYATEAAIPMYEWFAKLFKEGILDPNFVTNDTAKMRNLFLTDRVGIVTYWDAHVGLFNNLRKSQDPNTKFETKGLTGIPGPDGTILQRRGDPDFWIIPKNAANPEAAKKFLEFWNTEPGIMLGSLGILDVDYTKEGTTYKLTKQGTDHGMDHGIPFWYNSTVKEPFGKLPGVQAAQDQVTKYAKLELSLDGWNDAKKIIDNYALKAMSAQMPAKDAVQKMQEELKAAKLID
jgi:putative aldouronate transport system substrate-binding protein